jgi:hypothetical protein
MTDQLKQTLRGHITWVLTVSFDRTGTVMASAGSKAIAYGLLRLGKSFAT